MFKFKLLYVTFRKATVYTSVVNPPSLTYGIPDEFITDCVQQSINFCFFQPTSFDYLHGLAEIVKLWEYILESLTNLFTWNTTAKHILRLHVQRWCYRLESRKQKFQCQNVVGLLNQKCLTMVTQKNYTSRMTNRAENLLQEYTIVTMSVSNISSKSMELLLRE